MTATDVVKVGEPVAGPGFSTEQAITLRGETAALAQAEQAKAAVQARYLMALNRPRDWDGVRVSLLKECRRPGFAEVARYHKPIGKGVEGPSIRFAEAALRCMTNILAESSVVFDDDEKRVIRVSVTDLESNLTYPIEVVIAKTVERSKLPEGEKALRVRTNSFGKPVYILPATEDDLLNKQNAQVSKALRTSGLRLLPGDILDECMTLVLTTLRDRDAKDPDAARKKIVDGFAALGVPPSELKVYLGHDLSTASPAELAELRALWTAIKDGEATWSVALESKGKGTGNLTKPPAAGDDKRGTLDKIADALGGDVPPSSGGPGTATTPPPPSAPPCAGCGKPLDGEIRQDGEGRPWHHSCYNVPGAKIDWKGKEGRKA